MDAETQEVTPVTEEQVTPETETESSNVEETTETEANNEDTTEEKPYLGSYKTKEDAEVGLKEKNDTISQTSQKVSELTKKLADLENVKQEQERQKQEGAISAEETRLKNWYEATQKNEASLKAQALAELQANLQEQGYNPEQIKPILAQKDFELTETYNQRMSILHNTYSEQVNSVKTQRETFQKQHKEQSFKTIENDLKDELQDEAIKYVFDSYKQTNGDAQYFKNTVMPWIREAFKIRDTNKAKVEQVNTKKTEQSANQKTSGNATKDSIPNSGFLQSVMSDDVALASLLT